MINFKKEITSVWSFKKRGDWQTHKGDYRGNCPPQVIRNLLLMYTRESDVVLDPFCGSGTTLIETKLLNRKGIGIDINEKALRITKERLNFNTEKNVKQILVKGNSIKLDKIIKEEMIDFIFLHPPYANIIKYSDNIKNDISLLEYKEFLEKIEIIIDKCYKVLKKDKYCSILIGDIREKGSVIPLGFYIMNIFLNRGFKLKEIIIKEQHNCKMTDYWKNKKINFYLLAHEYIFVFKK